MLANYKRKANIAGTICLVGLVAVVATVSGIPGNIWDNGNVAAQLVMLVSIVAWFYALGAYAMAKGHSAWWALAGVLSILGLLILIVLPDRHSVSAPALVD